MKAEPNKHGTALKLAIVDLSQHLPPEYWRKVALVIADAIAEIRRLESVNRDLREDRDYWQHKWGNGNG